MRRISVLMTTEATYPFHAGGVSTWCDHLIRGCEDISFYLLTLMMSPFVKTIFDLPPNVRQMIKIPLWGVEEPAEYIREIPFSRVYLAKKRTTDQIIEEEFIPLFKAFIQKLEDSEKEAYALGELLYKMHLYFKENDFNQTFKSPMVWEIFRDELWRLALSNHTPIHHLPNLYNVTQCLRWVYRFFIQLNAQIPETDVTHSTAAGFCSIPCVIAKIGHGTPFLLTEHGVYMKEQSLAILKSDNTFYSRQFLLSLIICVSRISYAYADQISPVCNFNIRWETANNVPVEKIKTIYNGIDPNIFSPVERKRLKGAKYRVSTVARIDVLKDIETLIKTASYVKKRRGDVEFWIYGAPADQEYYERCLALRKDLDLEDTVVFAGHTDRPMDVYNECDIVILSSISEAFPYMVIEAMACAKPIVATDVGGVREALANCGIVTKPRDSEALGEGILKLIDDPEAREEMGREARERALAYFTIEKKIRLYSESYYRLSERKSLRAAS
jgi:glycosyltransferase involved in cell wall biosynthesis